MPVPLRSITGKVDYDVEQMLREIVVAIDRLEALPSVDLGPIRATLASLNDRLGDMEQRVQVLTQQVSDLIAAAP